MTDDAKQAAWDEWRMSRGWVSQAQLMHPTRHAFDAGWDTAVRAQKYVADERDQWMNEAKNQQAAADALEAQLQVAREAFRATAIRLHVESIYSAHLDGNPSWEDCPDPRCAANRATLAKMEAPNIPNKCSAPVLQDSRCNLEQGHDGPCTDISGFTAEAEQ